MNNNRIVYLIVPFALEQKAYIIQGDTERKISFSLPEADSALLDAAYANDIDEISLLGAHTFAKKIKKGIQKKELTKFHQNKINILIKEPKE